MKMKKNLIRACPICEEKSVEVLHTPKFVLPESHPLAGGYDVVCCERCGFVYADTQVSQAEYDRFYANFSKYEDNKTATGSGDSPSDAARLREMAKCIAGFLQNEHARVLDVGCANGGLLGFLKELGYENLCGIDPSPICVENTKRLHKVESHVGSIYTLSQHLGQFDCVIFSHVLEHVQSLAPVMACIGGLLKAGGTVYIEVPDATRYAEFVTAPFQDFNTKHINHFSQQCLQNLCGKFALIALHQGDKVLKVSPQTLYPAIYGFYAKADDGATRQEMRKDEALRAQILAYIARSQGIMDAIEDRLGKLLGESPEVIVWGTGQLTMKLLAETSLAKAKIKAFVDGNPINHGHKLNDVPILAPEQIKIRGLSQPIIVSSLIHHEAIAETIRHRMRLPNRVVFLAG